MIYRDPQNEILKAYVAILKNQIMLEGAPVAVGTKISQGETEYIHLSVDDIEDQGTGDGPLYRAYITLEIVSMQEKTEGNDEIVNGIAEQVLEIISEPDRFIMNNFTCVHVAPGGMERDSELTDTSYNIIRKLRMLNYVSQIK